MKQEEKVAQLKDRLAEALEAKGVRAIQLSEKTGIHRGTISYYLSGKSHPKADRLRVICEVLNVSEAWMLGYNVSMERVVHNEREVCVDVTALDQDTLNFGLSKAIDILIELQIDEETIKQMILKHFDIRYSEVTAILKNKH